MKKKGAAVFIHAKVVIGLIKCSDSPFRMSRQREDRGLIPPYNDPCRIFHAHGTYSDVNVQ